MFGNIRLEYGKVRNHDNYRITRRRISRELLQSSCPVHLGPFVCRTIVFDVLFGSRPNHAWYGLCTSRMQCQIHVEMAGRVHKAGRQPSLIRELESLELECLCFSTFYEFTRSIGFHNGFGWNGCVGRIACIRNHGCFSFSAFPTCHAI